MLNSHYACQTYAETFIASGRTDLLFRADDGATPSGLPAPDWQVYVTVALQAPIGLIRDVGLGAAGLSRSAALELAKRSAELESVVLALLGSTPLTDAVPSVDGRDVEAGHRGVTVGYFSETRAAGCEAVRSGQRASSDVDSAMKG